MKLHFCLPLILASSIAFAGVPIPAQPLTNLKTATKKDADEDADPFDIVQLDNRVLFLARNNAGFALYVRNLDDPTNAANGADPIIDLTLKKHTPLKLKPFSKNTEWDAVNFLGRRNIAIIDDEALNEPRASKPTEASLFFHVPGMGLYTSRATAGTTKKVIDVDVAKTNTDGRWLDSLVAHRSLAQVDAVFFAGDDKKKGVELFTAGPPQKPKGKLFADIVPGKDDSFPYQIVSSFRDLYFAAFSPVSSRYEIFHTDGDSAPTLYTQGLVEFPNWMTADEAGGVYFTLPETANGARDLYHLDRDGVFARNTTGGVNPTNVTYSGSGNVMYFAAHDATNGTELWSVSTSAPTAVVKTDINPGLNDANPAKITRAGTFTYFTANDGTARKLYRRTNSFLETVLEQGTNAPIIMDDTSEIMPVQRLESRPLGDFVYFTGTPQGGSEKLLYRIFDSAFDQTAVRVLTESGIPVRNARNLAKFVAPGLGGTYRLFFSCDGAGTEFSNSSATDKRFQPRGFELWCTEFGVQPE